MADAKKDIVIILAAGKGKRMMSSLPKVMHKVSGKPMLQYAVDAGLSVEPKQVVAVISDDLKDNYIKEIKGSVDYVIQHNPQGTGHAVQVALEEIKEDEGVSYILLGDTPLVGASIVSNMKEKIQGADLLVVGFEAEDPAQYGRLDIDSNGNVNRIVEFKDATDAERRITKCNAGILAAKTKYLREWVSKLDNNNKQNEYYLTDIDAIAEPPVVPSKINKNFSFSNSTL